MNEIIRPGSGILFMKVGTHAQETLSDIIKRKAIEIDQTVGGFGMWGYGGNTCHPSSMVQPFAKDFETRGIPIHLCMEEMESKHFAEPLCAAEYSTDSINWQPIPEAIEVRGSRYALIIGKVHKQTFDLHLNATRVPVGPSSGRLGSRYVSGRVDKACLEVMSETERSNEEVLPNARPISFVAELRAPYAVFLRNYR